MGNLDMGGEQRKGNHAISISTGSCTIIPLERRMKREAPEDMFGVAESIGGEAIRGCISLNP
jgi:hypothetical protein